MTIESMCEQYQENRDVALRNSIAMTVYPLIKMKARRYSSRQGIQDDLIQEGMIGVLEAVDTFNPASGCKFTTYGGNCGVFKMLSYMARTSDLLGLGRAGGQKLQFIIPKLRQEDTIDWTHSDIKDFCEKHNFPYDAVVFALGIQAIPAGGEVEYCAADEYSNPALQLEVDRQMACLEREFNKLAPSNQAFLLSYHLSECEERPAVASEWGVQPETLRVGAQRAKWALTKAMSKYESS